MMPRTIELQKEQARQRLHVARKMQVMALMEMTTIEALPPEWRNLPKGSEVKIVDTTMLKVTMI